MSVRNSRFLYLSFDDLAYLLDLDKDMAIKGIQKYEHEHELSKKGFVMRIESLKFPEIQVPGNSPIYPTLSELVVGRLA